MSAAGVDPAVLSGEHGTASKHAPKHVAVGPRAGRTGQLGSLRSRQFQAPAPTASVSRVDKGKELSVSDRPYSLMDRGFYALTGYPLYNYFLSGYQ